MEANNMTLDEAIAHCNEVAVACDTECRREHKQLADWLRELKDRRCYQGGNAAAMREAVHAVYNSLCDHEIIYPKERWRLIEIFDAAFSAPPRNCDVGTAEEQVARYNAFCAKMMKQNNHCCGPCPCYKFVNGEAQPCTLLWAQMPYEEGATK